MSKEDKASLTATSRDQNLKGPESDRLWVPGRGKKNLDANSRYRGSDLVQYEHMDFSDQGSHHVRQPTCRTLLGVLALVFVGLVVGCGSGEQSSDQRSGERISETRYVSPEAPALVSNACRSFESVALAANQFTEALTTASIQRLEKVTSGKFAWVSIDAPPSVVASFREYEHFVARSPRKLQQFMKRNGPVPLVLTALALASTSNRDYSDVAFRGAVPELPDLEMFGKGAINCDGTTRVWTMVIRDAMPTSEKSDVCATARPRRTVATPSGNVKVCLQ